MNLDKFCVLLRYLLSCKFLSWPKLRYCRHCAIPALFLRCLFSLRLVYCSTDASLHKFVGSALRRFLRNDCTRFCSLSLSCHRNVLASKKMSFISTSWISPYLPLQRMNLPEYTFPHYWNNTWQSQLLSHIVQQ